MPANAKQIIRDANEQKPNIQENTIEQFQAILDKLRNGESLTEEDREILAKMSTDDKNMASGKDEGMNMNLTDHDKEYHPDKEPKQVEAQPLENDGEHPEALADSPITTGMANNFDVRALYQKLPGEMSRAEKMGLIKQLKTNVNLLSGFHNDSEHITAALGVIGKLAELKNKGMSFKEALNQVVNRDKTIRNIVSELSPEDRKTMIDKLHETYKSEPFSKANREMAALTQSMRRSTTSAANAMEKFTEAVKNDDVGLQENKSADPKRVATNGGTAFAKAMATGNERGARTRNLLNNMDVWEKDPDAAKAILEAASKGKMTIDDWSKYFTEHPEAEFWINSNPGTVNSNTLLLSRKDKDTPDWEEVPLTQSEDVRDFFKFIADNNLSDKVHVEHTNLNSKASDATDDTNRNKKWLDRYKQALTTGDTRYVFQDPSINKLVDRDENGFVTETNRDKNTSGLNGKWSDSYFKHVANMFNNSSPDQLMDFLLDKMSDGNPIIAEQNALKDGLGADSLNKANSLAKDIIGLMYGLRGVDPTTDTGINIDKGLINKSVAQSLANKIGQLRKENPNIGSIAEILKSGNIGDILGRIHPKFNDKRMDIVNAWMKYNKYKKALDEGTSSSELFRDFLDKNIPALQNVIDTGDFGTTGLSDMNQVKDLLDQLNNARDVFSSNKEKEAKVNAQLDRSLDKLESLADIDPDAFNEAQQKYSDAMDELLAAKDSNADFDVLNMLRAEMEKARSTVEYLKNTKVDIDAEAKRQGKPYADVLNDYLHPDWDETDFDTQLAKRLAEHEINDNIRMMLGDKDKNGYMLSLLDKFAGLSPEYAEAADSIRNLKKPMTLSQLLKDKTGKTAMYELGLTPEEFSALASSEEAFKTDASDKRRNTSFVGAKSSAGAGHADELSEQEKSELKSVGHTMSQAKSKPENGPGDAAVAQMQADLHDAEMTGDAEAKQAIADRVIKDNANSAHPYTKHEEAQKRLDDASADLSDVIDILKDLKWR